LLKLVATSNDFHENGYSATAGLLMGIANMFCEDANIQPASFVDAQ
jgi:hypothetical protein